MWKKSDHVAEDCNFYKKLKLKADKYYLLFPKFYIIFVTT